MMNNWNLSGPSSINTDPTFQCSFKWLEDIAEQEPKSSHQLYPCPTTGAPCFWQGQVKHLHAHFLAYHAELVRGAVEFKLDRHKDSQGLFMVAANSLPIIIKYLFDAHSNTLCYYVGLCTSDKGFEASFKLELVDGSDSGHSIGLKMNKCGLFDDRFYGMENSKTLDLSKFRQVLGDARFITVLIKLKVVRLNTVFPIDDFKKIPNC